MLWVDCCIRLFVFSWLMLGGVVDVAICVSGYCVLACLVCACIHLFVWGNYGGDWIYLCFGCEWVRCLLAVCSLLWLFVVLLLLILWFCFCFVCWLVFVSCIGLGGFGCFGLLADALICLCCLRVWVGGFVCLCLLFCLCSSVLLSCVGFWFWHVCYVCGIVFSLFSVSLWLINNVASFFSFLFDFVLILG